MNEKKEFDSDIDFTTLGHYVEGDYMAEEEYYEKEVIFAQENLAGFKIAVRKDYIIEVRGPNQTTVVYDFDNKEDWEAFCEATWKTENYIPMKRTDFIEFFKALQFVYNHHQNQLTQAKLKHDRVKGWIDEQENNLNKLQDIIIGYEEVYNESKV